MDSSRQFAQSFANDLETIRRAGFNVVISQKRYETKLYIIQMYRLVRLIVAIFDSLLHGREFFIGQKIKVSGSFSG